MPGLAVTGLVVLCATAAPAAFAARHSTVVCHATGATWHLAEYFHERDANGDIVVRPARGNRYNYYGGSETFCHKMNRWILRLTGAANKDNGFENTTTGKLHIPTGYDLIAKEFSPPGYNCFATIDDPRPKHHHDNPHQGSCVGQTGHEHSLQPITWFPVLPPEKPPARQNGR